MLSSSPLYVVHPKDSKYSPPCIIAFCENVISYICPGFASTGLQSSSILFVPVISVPFLSLKVKAKIGFF